MKLFPLKYRSVEQNELRRRKAASNFLFLLNFWMSLQIGRAVSERGKDCSKKRNLDAFWRNKLSSKHISYHLAVRMNDVQKIPHSFLLYFLVHAKSYLTQQLVLIPSFSIFIFCLLLLLVCFVIPCNISQGFSTFFIKRFSIIFSCFSEGWITSEKNI